MINNLQLSCDNIFNSELNSQLLTLKDITEGRDLYLECLAQPNYTDVIKEQLVNPLIEKYSVNSTEDTLIKIKIIPKNNINKSTDMFITNNVFTFGRSSKCNIILNDIDVSRIHFFGIIIKDKILILDTWSLYGTNLYNNKEELDNSIGNRHILKIDRNKRHILELKNYLVVINPQKVLNDKYCIICMAAPRIIRNNCGHGVLCQDCNNRLKTFNTEHQCPICKELMDNAVISDCAITYQSNTL